MPHMQLVEQGFKLLLPPGTVEVLAIFQNRKDILFGTEFSED